VSEVVSKAAFALDGLIGRWAWVHEKSWHLILVASKGDGVDG
jgi:hypothetical protein